MTGLQPAEQQPAPPLQYVAKWTLDYVATAIMAQFARDDQQVNDEDHRAGLIEPISAHRIRSSSMDALSGVGDNANPPVEFRQTGNWWIDDAGYARVAVSNVYGSSLGTTMLCSPIIMAQGEIAFVAPHVRDDLREGMCYMVGGYRTPMRTEAVLHSYKPRYGVPV